MPGEVPFAASAIYGQHTGRGLVDVLWLDGKRYQITPDEARRVSRILLEVAEAAEQDEAVVAACKAGGLDDREVVVFMRSVREARARLASERQSDA